MTMEKNMDGRRLNYEKVAPYFGPWASRFKSFIEGKELYDIYQKLKAESLSGEIIVPKAENIYKTFELSNPDNVKVVFYMMDPYPRRYINKVPQATGVALDCSSSPDKKLQPSLIKFYDAISREIGHKIEYSPSLYYLLQQGVLMLNTDLTCRHMKTGSHEGLWEPFQKYFLQEIMGSYTGVIYVLCGKSSKRMRKYIYELGNHVFELEHPEAAERAGRDWNSNGIFNMINSILKSSNGPYSHIFWDKKEWEEPPPF